MDLFAQFNNFLNQFVIARIAYIVLILFIIGQVLIKLAKMALKAKIKMKNEKATRRLKTVLSLSSSLISYSLSIIGIFLILATVGIDTNSLLAGAGVLGLIFGFGFQGLLSDMMAGFFIAVEGTFVLGDFIEVEENSGEIISMGLKTTVLQLFNGATMTLNNSDLRKIINYSTDYSMVIEKFLIPSGVSVQELKQDLKPVLDKFKSDNNNIIGEIDFQGVSSFQATGVEIMIFFKVRVMTHYQLGLDFRNVLVEFIATNKKYACLYNKW